MAELKSQGQNILTRLDGIDGRLNGIDKRMNTVTSEVLDIKNGLAKTNTELKEHQTRLDSTEQRISDLEDTLNATKRELHRAQNIIKTLEAKSDDLENRGRRKNLVLMGLPEQSEGQQITTYVQQMLPRWLNLTLELPLEVERAHRTLQPAPLPGKPPRPILIRFLRFRDREMILQAAKKSTQLREGDAKLTLRQDLSAELRRKRKEFSDIIEYLIREGKFRGFAYPHRLRVWHRGSVVLFDNPRDAQDFIKKLEDKQVDAQQTEVGQ
ncbi:hypothetical protein NL108_018606 [Boleophthalmus pectinirostris]|nr:hypothetical protein NL108_018606 [Boleophthalmus pectinirostris]